MTGPSPHLSWNELACRDGTPYPFGWRGARVAVLAREFEAVRRLLGEAVGREVPLTVHSAYRTAAYNERVGGSPRSQHLYGRALDVAPDDPAILSALWEAVLQRARAVLAIRGAGRYDAFVHFDIRPADKLALWDERSTR